ncbi:hypothetical protein ANTQUA_LOCUS8254 [Anthophora quadrimaculata]
MDISKRQKIRRDHEEKQKKQIKLEQKSKAKKRYSEHNNEEEEHYCPVCTESYSTSKPNEKWVQCTECKDWAHEECIVKNLNYVCCNCDTE